MSDYLIKGETLTDIANAIRGKTGSTSPIRTQDFATEIEGIQAGGGGGDIDGLIDGTLTEVTSNATSIRQYAFYRATITTANFPLATSIASSAFSYCETLTTIDCPNATTIGSFTFQSCDSLVTANIPNAIRVPNDAFNGCDSLVTANFPNATYVGSNAFSNCNKLTTANFPNATSIHSSYAFLNCYNLTTIDFSNVTSIGTSAFSSCNKLTTANFPLAISTGSSAFRNCYQLQTANFPNATNVPASSFANCYKLTKVIIGTNKTTSPTLSNINAFDGCHHITGTVNATYNPEGLKDGYIYVKADKVAEVRTATNWVTYATQIMPWVATVEELANIDGTTYDHACIGEGVDSVEYYYNGTSWEVFR